MNRFKAFLWLIVVLSVLLASCTASPTATSDSQGQQTSNQESITLQLWGFSGEYEFLPDVINSFNEEHPNITVEITDIPEGDYVTKIDTALLANEPPDLGYIYVDRWIKGGAFAALDSALQQANINVDDYNPGVMSTCIYEGKVYCIGTYTGVVLMYYNKDLFDAAGVTYPSSTEPMTIDEYAVMIEKLTKHSDDINERIWGGDAGAAYWWIDRLTMFSPDGRTTEGYVNDEATIHFYDVISQFPKQGTVISGAESQLLQGSDLVATGKLATTIIDNVVAIPSFEAANIRYGAAPPPVEKAGDLPYAPTWTDAYGVFANSKHPEEAKMFLTYLVQKGNQIRLDQGTLPLDLKLAADNHYGDDNEGRKETLEATQVAGREVLNVPGFWDVVGPIDDGFSQMVEDGTPAKEVLDSIAPDMQKTLDQSWKTWESIQ